MQESQEGCLGLQFDFPVARERTQRVLVLLFRCVLASRIQDRRTVFFLHDVVTAVRFRPTREYMSSRLVQHAKVRAEMRGCFLNLLRHSLSWHESCAARGERGSRRIVPRSQHVTQEISEAGNARGQVCAGAMQVARAFYPRSVDACSFLCS